MKALYVTKKNLVLINKKQEAMEKKTSSEINVNVAEEQQVVTTTKKPFYKRWGFWLATTLSVAGICGGVYAYRKHAASKGAASAPVAKNEAEQPRVGHDNRVKIGDNNKRHEFKNNNINN